MCFEWMNVGWSIILSPRLHKLISFLFYFVNESVFVCACLFNFFFQRNKILEIINWMDFLKDKVERKNESLFNEKSAISWLMDFFLLNLNFISKNRILKNYATKKWKKKLFIFIALLATDSVKNKIITITFLRINCL